MAAVRQKGHRIFYGWWIVLFAGVGLLFCYGPVIVYTFSIFFKPLSQEMGWSRAQISLGLSISLIAMTVTFPVIGRLVDRLGAKKVVLVAALIFGIGLMSFYFHGGSLLYFYGVYLVLGIAGGATGSSSYFAVVSRWFDKNRGLALGLANLGVGIGALVLPAVAQFLISNYGWRKAYLFLGALVIAVTVPLAGLGLKESPRDIGALPDGDSPDHSSVDEVSERPHLPQEQPGLSIREALSRKAFWLICGAFFLFSASLNGCLTHLVLILTDRGVSTWSAAFAVSLLGGATLVGRGGTGYLLDRFFAPYVAVCFFSGAVLGIMLLWNGAIGATALIAAALLGLGNGAEGDIIAYQVSRYFGLRCFAEIYSYALASYTLGGVVGPLAMGLGFDYTGSYSLILLAFALAMLVGIGMMTRLGPYWIQTEATASAATPA
jgi:MFS family permease